MPEYIVRARKAPTDAGLFVKAIGSAARVEYLAQIMTNCLFVSKGHRRDTTLTLVLEDSTDFSRALSLNG
ncbi:MAG: tRNA (pseudouridine(54)-N(1))-methyltransferase TrmY, partial [bacterium]